MIGDSNKKKKCNKKKVVKLINIWWPRILVVASVFFLLWQSNINGKELNYDQLKNVVDLQWVLFSISVAIYLFWHGYMLNYFARLTPKFDNQNLLKFKEYVESKMTISQALSMSLLPAIFLLLNLFAILFSTFLIYVMEDDASDFVRSIVIFTLYLATNTLSCLFVDTVGNLFVEKKKLSDACKVTDDEKQLYEKINRILVWEVLVDSLKEEINSNPEVNDKTKAECNKILEKHRNILYTDCESVNLSDKSSEEK